MSQEQQDYYELLQISPNAEPETIHRVYRMLAQRYHPDNQLTGDGTRFRQLVDAYAVLADVERRAKYDLLYNQIKKTRWQPVAGPDRVSGPIEIEQMVRRTVLEVLYQRRRAEPGKPGVFVLDLEEITGHAREHLEFTVWYLSKKGFVTREDSSKLSITADGIDFVESFYFEHGARRQLDSRTPQR
jgi:curved DNA-binding protein CbpA